MSVQEPKTLDEWRLYADTLDGEELYQVAEAANTLEFVEQLQEEGYAAEDIHAVLTAIARRFKTTGLRPTSDGYLDFFRLMNE